MNGHGAGATQDRESRERHGRCSATVFCPTPPQPARPGGQPPGVCRCGRHAGQACTCSPPNIGEGVEAKSNDFHGNTQPLPEADPLDALLADRRVWRGEAPSGTAGVEPSGHTALDRALPGGGWPEAALIEILHAADGLGELRLLLPTLARHTGAGRAVALVAPPYLPNPAAWLQAGIDLRQVHLVDAPPAQAAWASEQCLRAGCLSAVLCWPRQADERALRRLQVAAASGHTLAFALRPLAAARNPSPAALRLQLERGGLRVLKCRGGHAPAQALPAPALVH